MTRHSGLSLIGLLGAVGQIRRHFVIAMALVAFSGCSQNMAIKEVVSGKAKALKVTCDVGTTAKLCEYRARRKACSTGEYVKFVDLGNLRSTASKEGKARVEYQFQCVKAGALSGDFALDIEFEFVRAEADGRTLDASANPNGGAVVKDGEREWVIGPMFAWSSSINFELTNSGKEAVRVIWDEGALVDVDAVSHRIAHQGVRIIERNSSMPPTVIAPGSKIENSVFNVDSFEFTNRWNTKPFLPTERKTWDEAAALSKALVGKEMRLLLPIEIAGRKTQHSFVIKIKRAEALVSQSASRLDEL
jgi:hypothetical protein